MRELGEFQRQFDIVQQNFDEIEELNKKSRQMKELVKGIYKKYEKATPGAKASVNGQKAQR